jgi:hypothetical protein
LLGSEQAFAVAQSQADLAQEAQVCLRRIQQAVQQAYATEQFPGFIVAETPVGQWNIPNTLVVWNPRGPVNTARSVPYPSELVIFCPDPRNPERLLEVHPGAGLESCPSPEDKPAWQKWVLAVLDSPESQVVLLTDRLRTARIGDNDSGSLCAGVFFFDMLRPSQEELAQFRAGNRSWEALPWVLNLYGAQYGLRQHWVRIELQLRTGSTLVSAGPEEVLPFFGSAAIYFGIRRSM